VSATKVSILFRSAALFNWAAALLFLPTTGLAHRFGLHPAPTGTWLEHFGIAAVVLFGFGYWMAGGPPEHHRGIIQLGLVGKVTAVLIVFGHYLDDTANLQLTLVILGDAVFVGLFAWYLVSSRRLDPVGEHRTHPDASLAELEG
jgi:hypothetical protein